MKTLFPDGTRDIGHPVQLANTVHDTNIKNEANTVNNTTAQQQHTAAPLLARVTDCPIDEAAVRRAVEADDCGAVTIFLGVIRNHDGGESVSALDYSAHPEAERILAEIVTAEQSRTGLRLAAWHRIGELGVGDSALVAAAAAAHRREAFAAIETLVERIKAEVPIWKRQHYTTGASAWVGL